MASKIAQNHHSDVSVVDGCSNLVSAEENDFVQRQDLLASLTLKDLDLGIRPVSEVPRNLEADKVAVVPRVFFSSDQCRGYLQDPLPTETS